MAEKQRHVKVGPVVWRQIDGAKVWYFVVAPRDTLDDYPMDVVVRETRADALDARATIIAVSKSAGLTVHDHHVDDEAHASRISQTLWPPAAVKRRVDQLAAERRQFRHG